MEDPKGIKEQTKKTAIETAKEWGGEHAFSYASSNSDGDNRVSAEFAYRKSVTIVHTCDSCLRPACSTFSSCSYDLPTITPIFDIPQSARLQG